jgi:hypothetical protein
MTELLYPEGMRALRFEHLDGAGQRRDVVIVRRAFDIGDDGQVVPRAVAPPFVLGETPFEEAGGALRFESELAPWKPGGELVLHATAHAPGSRATTRFDAQLAVFGADSPGVPLVDERLSVTGPRVCEYGRAGLTFASRWRVTPPEPTLSVPIRFDRSFGGTVRLDAGRPEEAGARVAFPGNPVGMGFVPTAEMAAEQLDLQRSDASVALDEWAERVRRIDAPQVERPSEPFEHPMRPTPLAGWGIVAKHWDYRLPFAGTFDEDWRSKRFPLLPTDFDARYWCGSRTELRFPKLPREVEIRTSGLVKDSSRNQAFTVRLSTGRLELHVFDRTRSKQLLDLRADTLWVDLDSKEAIVIYRVDVEHSETMDALIVRGEET